MSFPFPVSPSQINTARQCWRKYGLEYIDKIEYEPNQYAALGTEMHGHLEEWFRKGKLPPIGTQAGQMARVALRQWPAPARVDECEIHIGTETESAVYHGYQDIGHLHNKMLLRVVGDHKSCGDHKWAKTPKELKLDPQAVIYAAAAMVRHQVTEVICKWVYTTRGKKPQSKAVVVKMTQADVEAGFDSLDETARDIYWVRTQPGITGMDLPPNPTACGAFGGCSHIERCNLSAKEKLRGYMAQQTLREKIEANKAAKAAGQSVAKPAGKPALAPKTAKSEPKTEETAKEKLLRIKAEKAAKKAEEEEADLEISDEDEEIEDEELEEEEEEIPETPVTKASIPAKTSKPAASKPAKASSPSEHGHSHGNGAPKSYMAQLVVEGKDGNTYEIQELGFRFTVKLAVVAAI